MWMCSMLKSDGGWCVCRNWSGLVRCSKALLNLYFSELLSIRMEGPGRVSTPRYILRLFWLLITLYFHQTTNACWTQFVPLVFACVLLWNWCWNFSRELFDKVFLNFLKMFLSLRHQDASLIPFSVGTDMGQNMRFCGFGDTDMGTKCEVLPVSGHRSWDRVSCKFVCGHRYGVWSVSSCKTL